MKWIVVRLTVIVGIGALLFVGLWYLDSLDHRWHWPVERKLARITADRVEAVVTWPTAEAFGFNLVAGLPMDPLALSTIPRPCPEFQADVTILTAQADVVERFSLATADATRCNWLYHHGLDAFALTWHQRNSVLQSCEPGETYTIRLDFTSRPTEFTWLWLSYAELR